LAFKEPKKTWLNKHVKKRQRKGMERETVEDGAEWLRFMV
jgi:hypothetical protein